MKMRLRRDLEGDTIAASDGYVGMVHDAYFDDERLALRYFVVDTGDWLTRRRVLISPASLDAPIGGTIPARITRRQVERAPGVEEDQPVSRLYEQAHARHYGHPYYWSGPLLWGMAAAPPPPANDIDYGSDEASAQAAKRARASHLRSSREVIGYRVECPDGTLGKADDLVVDDRDWSLDALVVDTREWWPGGQIEVPAGAIRSIDWGQRRIQLGLTREALRA